MKHGLALGMVVVVGALSACAAPRSYTFDTAEMARAQSGADRQVIRRAWMSVTVGDLDEAVADVEDITGRVEGVIESSQRQEDQSVHLVLRVPAATLESVLEDFAALGTVDRQRVSTDDVTDQVVDLDARLTNLVAVRDRLRGYLDRAEDLEDIVAIERELTRVQTEIDTLTNQLDRLRSQVAMSQVSLTLNRKTVLGPLGLVVAGLAWVVEKLFVIK